VLASACAVNVRNGSKADVRVNVRNGWETGIAITIQKRPSAALRRS
jgi:hypothetical protein